MQHLEYSFCHIEEVLNANFGIIVLSYMLCTSKIHGNYLGTSLVIGNLMRIRVEVASCLVCCLVLMVIWGRDH